ncbi:hypothetical protein KY290_001268 [Solanum tuberosum]|uniref:Uncharacterized protein n=1 Tax=Solanum tuberosum TaxID=4113 RepID=A0ABQ7WM77_SOLTU|nr:hypothetical protein KY285_001182 [Solanum tuberosum]KAH0781670.1 hypothetical protein KY290_001268 [Solanum tuberosum]
MISPRVLERRESGKNLSYSVTEKSDDSSVTQGDPTPSTLSFACYSLRPEKEPPLGFLGLSNQRMPIPPLMTPSRESPWRLRFHKRYFRILYLRQLFEFLMICN